MDGFSASFSCVVQLVFELEITARAPIYPDIFQRVVSFVRGLDGLSEFLQIFVQRLPCLGVGKVRRQPDFDAQTSEPAQDRLRQGAETRRRDAAARDARRLYFTRYLRGDWVDLDARGVAVVKNAARFCVDLLARLQYRCLGARVRAFLAEQGLQNETETAVLDRNRLACLRMVAALLVALSMQPLTPAVVWKQQFSIDHVSNFGW